jgi:hypothetical protein
MGRPADTSADAHRSQLEALRSMTPAQRLRIADELSTAVLALASSGMRHRRESATASHPERPDPVR